MEDRTMRTVKYSELSRAMHDFTKQIDTLDECIGLSSRIIVLKDGLVSKEFACDVGHKPSQVEIVKYMM